MFGENYSNNSHAPPREAMSVELFFFSKVSLSLSLFASLWLKSSASFPPFFFEPEKAPEVKRKRMRRRQNGSCRWGSEFCIRIPNMRPGVGNGWLWQDGAGAGAGGAGREGGIGPGEGGPWSPLLASFELTCGLFSIETDCLPA